jgi:hypothetical protein
MNAPHRQSSNPPRHMDARPRIEAGFIPDVALDLWLRPGDAARVGASLTTRDGRRFMLCDAVRVLGRRNADVDLYGYTGRVETLRSFIRQGAVLSADGVRLGSAIYDIEYGVLATPVASADESGMNPAQR